LNFDDVSQLGSPLSKSLLFSPDVNMNKTDFNITMNDSNEDKAIITPIPPQKKEKNNSEITSKLTPLLSGSCLLQE